VTLKKEKNNEIPNPKPHQQRLVEKLKGHKTLKFTG